MHGKRLGGGYVIALQGVGGECKAKGLRNHRAQWLDTVDRRKATSISLTDAMRCKANAQRITVLPEKWLKHGKGTGRNITGARR